MTLVIQEAVFRSRRARWATTLLGAILTAEGAGKLLDLPGYVAALVPFSAIPASLLWPVGLAWMCAELVGGMGLLAAGLAKAPPRNLIRTAARLAVVISVSYLLLTGQAYLRGLEVDNCTCFGVYLPQRLSWFILVQDVYMITYAVWQLRRIRLW